MAGGAKFERGSGPAKFASAKKTANDRVVYREAA